MTENLLAHETSPYLLQHRDNPVHWQPWNPETLARAKREGKPILLSVGYAACHWCHVMAHESFEDDAIAGVMNELFINIKVDREERPDIDAVYQAALQMMGEHGGWPLTMFLTPDAEPFWGGTYFPSTAKYGRPAFPDILRGIAHAFSEDREKVADNVAQLRKGLEQLGRPQGGGALNADRLNQAATAALRMVDPIRGGTLGAPKFPQVNLFMMLWRAYRRTGSRMFRDAVTLTLDNICQGGIYDHLGGGFARYSTDDQWLAPHFEKMLYDNALLIELLTDAWAATGNPLYAVRVRETIDWALREMRSGDAESFAFTAALDADSEGEEGKFYVWTETEIDAVLGPDADAFKAAYDVTPGGNWEGKTILNRSHQLALGDEETEAALEAARGKLLAERATRIRPQRDDKVLADWNGMMIAALAKAGAVMGEPAWTAAAENVFAFIAETMTEGSRLRHSWCAGALKHPATVDDYANLTRAALMLLSVTGNGAYLDRARGWVETADKHYWDAEANGYFLSADDTTDVIQRSKNAIDNAVPSGNGIMAEVLARLHHLTGEDRYRERAEAVFHVMAASELDHLMHQPALLCAYEIFSDGEQIVIAPGDKAGDKDGGDEEEAQALLAAVYRAGLENRSVLRLAPGANAPKGHPAFGKGPHGGRAAAYVCRAQTCGLAITEPDALTQALGGGPDSA